MEATSAERNSEIFDNLVRAQIEIWNRIDDRLRSVHDVRLGTLQIMRVIASRSGCRVNDVADEMVITIGGASKLIDRLEASGLCERRANPDDRRSSLLTLTPDGKKLLDRASRTFDAVLAESLGALSADQINALAPSLAALRSSQSETR